MKTRRFQGVDPSRVKYARDMAIVHSSDTAQVLFDHDGMPFTKEIDGVTFVAVTNGSYIRYMRKDAFNWSRNGNRR